MLSTRNGSRVPGDRRLRHCLQTVGLGGAHCTLKLARSPDRKVQRVREFAFARQPAEVTLHAKLGLLAESNETADGPRQRIQLAKVVENRSTDTVIGRVLSKHWRSG